MAGFVIPQGVMDGCKNGFAAVDAEGSGVMYIEDLKQGFRVCSQLPGTLLLSFLRAAEMQHRHAWCSEC